MEEFRNKHALEEGEKINTIFWSMLKMRILGDILRGKWIRKGRGVSGEEGKRLEGLKE